MHDPRTAASCLRVLELLGSGAYTPIEESVIRLCAGFDPAHHDITLVYPYNGPFAEQASRLRCAQAITGMWDHLDWYSLSALVQLIKHRRIDIIHAHLPKAIQLGAVAAQLCGIPCIATLYQPPGYAEQRIGEVCPVIWVAASEAIRQVSQVEIAEVIQLTATALLQFTVRSAYDLPEAIPLVAYAGRLDEAGGADRFVNAALQLLPTLPQVHWLMIGNGPLEYELRRKSHQQQRIHFRSYSPELLSLVDLAVFPAREAMLAPLAMDLITTGVPVIASRAGVFSELIPFECMLFDAGRPCSLENAIEAYFRDPASSKTISRDLQQQAQRLWSPAETARHYSNLFMQV